MGNHSPTFMHTCLYCSNELDDETSRYCQTCRDRLEKVNERWAQRPNAPALHGLSDGPGTQELHFMRQDPYRERLAAMKSLEDNGKLNEPGAKDLAKKFVDELKDVPGLKKDLGNERHPYLDD